MKPSFLKALLLNASLSAILVAPSASALVIYNDRSAWETAVDSFVTDTFDEFLTDTGFITLDRGLFSLDGSSSGGNNLIDLPPYASSPESPILSTTPRVNLRGITNDFFINFLNPVSAFGFDIINYDNSGDVGSILIDGQEQGLFPMDDAPAVSFFGFVGGPASQVAISPNLGGSHFHAFDNVSIGRVAPGDDSEIPAPATLGLIGLGLLLLRRRQNSAA